MVFTTLFLAIVAAAQTPSPAVGVWKGTSVCMIHPSSCHDETAVYRISQVARDSVAIDGRKVVNGEEVQMGVMPCVSRRAQVTCVMPQGVWTFEIRGDSLVGELRHPDNKKFRDVRLVRSH